MLVSLMLINETKGLPVGIQLSLFYSDAQHRPFDFIFFWDKETLSGILWIFLSKLFAHDVVLLSFVVSLFWFYPQNCVIKR